ncbi:MAG: 7-cyano-7-deazaguanine synthase QueC [Nitrospirota bacterium]
MGDKRAVVLLSGGIDSSTALAFAKSGGYQIYALSFNYGQRHKREIDSARMVASALGVKKHLIVKFDLREIGGSALTSEMEVPKKVRSQRSKVKSENTTNKRLATRDSRLSTIPVTYVPARNTIFLSFGLAWAEVLEAEDIFIGANAVDYSGYPDCRPEYLATFEEMANLATKASVEGELKFKIKAPFIAMKKSEIIKKGIELGLDYSLTWSCYDPQPVKVKSEKLKFKTQNLKLIPCGRCDSCVFRARAFKELEIGDPLINE